MKYDLIIACGDSYTEGQRYLLEIPVEETWPGLVAKHYGVPFMNLSRGGCGNAEIAMQPLLHTTPDQKRMISNAKNPLFLFNFTVFHRLLLADTFTGLPGTAFSILPEHMDQEKRFLIKQAQHFLNDSWLNSDNNDMKYISDKQVNTDDTEGKELDWYAFSAMQAIRLAMSWEYLYTNATVAWGFIHFDTGALRDNSLLKIYKGNDTSEYINMKYPYKQFCYNEHINWKPVQTHVLEEPVGENCQTRTIMDLACSIHDAHPNKKGIKALSEFFIDYIGSL